MERFLFTDGKNGVKEVQSLDEMHELIANSEQPEAVKVWLFNSSEWISYAAFRKQFPAPARKEKVVTPSNGYAIVTTAQEQQVVQFHSQPTKKRRRHWATKLFYAVALAAGVFLVFNFTKIKWQKAASVSITAARPSNMPVMDIDSLIDVIEYTRGQSIDRSTKNNLRLRNSWPDQLSLQLNADRETSGSASRFFNVDVTIDNSTGFNIDNAVVKLSVWKDKKVTLTDTVRFASIKYDKPSKRSLEFRYKGDSISVAFESIRAKSFNFCYSAATKNNSGDYNDRWFCRE